MDNNTVKKLYHKIVIGVGGTREQRFLHFLDVIKLVSPNDYERLEIVSTDDDVAILISNNISKWYEFNDDYKTHDNFYQKLKADKIGFKENGKKEVDFWLVVDSENHDKHKDFLGVIEI